MEFENTTVHLPLLHMKVLLVYILNKAGGLIYQADVNPGLAKLSVNDYLVLAGTLHGVHAIGSRLAQSFDTSPTSSNTVSSSTNSQILQSSRAANPNTNRSGLQNIETALFDLYIFQSVSGLKFILITTPAAKDQIPRATTSKIDLRSQVTLANEMFRQLYILYGDYVMKDPFYSLDMPIKSAFFDGRVRQLCC